jgi:molybdopterin-binding protein
VWIIYAWRHLFIAAKRAITFMEVMMKISARNIIGGTIVEVKKGQTTAHVRVDIGGPVVTTSITNESVDELHLAKAQKVHVVIKSSDVMIAVD